MARDAATEEEGTDDEELRVITDHPDIDGFEDLTGEIEGCDLGIDTLDALSRGDLLSYHRGHDADGWFVVTGRHDASGKTEDETDIIEMSVLNSYDDTLLSEQASVAYLHSLAVFGELEVQTGVRAFVTRLAGKVREKRDAMEFRRGVSR